VASGVYFGKWSAVHVYQKDCEQGFEEMGYGGFFPFSAPFEVPAGGRNAGGSGISRLGERRVCEQCTGVRIPSNAAGIAGSFADEQG